MFPNVQDTHFLPFLSCLDEPSSQPSHPVPVASLPVPLFACAREEGRMVVLQNCKGGSSLLRSYLLPTPQFQHCQQAKQGGVMHYSSQVISVSCPLSSMICATLGMARCSRNATVFPGEVSRHNLFNTLHFGF